MRYIPIGGANCLIGGYVGKPKRNGRHVPFVMPGLDPGIHSVSVTVS
jgi:hypothetical protein